MKNKAETSVRAWEEQIVFPTYPAYPADPNPMFLEKRVYQGSSGKVYPNPFTDRIATEPCERTYRAIYLENEYVRLMILPEIGGRIHAALDKTNGYDFFYRQNVIKPALVGLLGPWISGGVEFNWPQHHRPSTFMPVHASIEHGRDGSATVWLSEHDPMLRMKGMVGICLRPASSLIEARVQLYNRTPMMQTFLWWANVAVHVDSSYEAFFPPDVHFVADHAMRAISHFPIARNFYYGVDYTSGVDLRWYKNIPVPTSYMVTDSQYDFFGGYDHGREAGFVHVADRHIAPGKKLWTWGNSEFGQAWDRNLTDTDGPYVELMAGVYTDNQPDFSWLAPYETRTFSQFWYPIQQIGPLLRANTRLALSLLEKGDRMRVGLAAPEHIQDCRVKAWRRGKPIFSAHATVAPGEPWFGTIPSVESPDAELHKSEPDAGTANFHLEVRAATGELLLEYQPEELPAANPPAAATEPPQPSEIHSTDELYITGLHLEQYRHATRRPEPYWEEGLRRDPGDARMNNAMGLAALRRGEFTRAERCFRAAIERLTLRNPNPRDGEPFYNLGTALFWQQTAAAITNAYEAFYKSTWNSAWRAAGYFALARISSMQQDYSQALSHLDESLNSNSHNLKARDLKASLLRHLSRGDEARALLEETLQSDPLDFLALAEAAIASDEPVPDAITALGGDIQTALDVAYDYSAAGLWNDAARWLRLVATQTHTDYPMVFYTQAWLADIGGDDSASTEYRQRAAKAPSLYCFPSRLEEMVILEKTIERAPQDAKARYYLGNFYYDRRRYEDAISCWRASVELEPNFSIPWRNLGIAEYNIRHSPEAALAAYHKATEANPADARLLYEVDQLRKRMGVQPEKRLAALVSAPELVARRDDLVVEQTALLNLTGEYERALEILAGRRFNPWEGGEGLVSAQWVTAHTALGRKLIGTGDFTGAIEHFRLARNYPKNLGEGKHLLTLERQLDYWEGFAQAKAGNKAAAETLYRAAAQPLPEPSVHSYYRALALAQLGKAEDAQSELSRLHSYATELRKQDPKIPYFAASLPNFLLFDDDPGKRNQVESIVLEAYAELGMQHRQRSAQLFAEVLELEPSHFLARVEVARLESIEKSRA